MPRKFFVLFVIFLTLAPATLSAKEKFEAPAPLRPWVGWVLYDHQEELHCPPNYNDSGTVRCNWPTSLDLDIHSDKGSFNQKWHLEYESWLQLPGNELNWPEKVTVDGRPASVLDRHGVPGIKLERGDYEIRGAFSWQTRPEYLQINANTGLLSLKIDGKSIDFPNLDQSGRVWLHAGKEMEKEIEDSLQIQAFRMIDDKIPARVVLEFNLDAAGSAREVILGVPFPPDRFIPLSLTSSLPARLEKDGRLRLQVRPGQWRLTLTARHIDPLSALTFTRPDDEYWPASEIWVFAKENNRIVEIEGVPAIDPQQTNLPENWRNLPAYRLQNGDEMSFKLIQRGNPNPAPDQLRLQRDLWLRFDGSGYTIQDRISGKKTSDWRLEMAPPIILGRVAIDGAEQFITRMEGSDKTGIELRNGLVNLTADSEYRGPISRIPAIGWDQDFQQVAARLFLPPGYRLLHATGIDNIPSTWLNRWTLLDIFVLLIFTIALAKLYSRPVAALGFATMVLLYHEPGAPRWIWLAILIGIALVRNLPEGKARKSAKIYRGLTFLLLIIIAIPFSIRQIRVGIYPQLEKPWLAMGDIQTSRPLVSALAVEEEPEPGADIVMKSAGKFADMEEKAASRIIGGYSGKPEHGYSGTKQVAQFDPAMVNQTGPGIPGWQWNTAQMSWSGPVKRGQSVNLFLIGPGTFLFLAFLRVGLIILLALRLIGVEFSRSEGWRFPDAKTLLLITLLFLPLIPAKGRATDIPSPEMFEELRSRLLEKENCFPNCADIPFMALAITQDRLDLELEVVAGTKVAIPLPGHPQHWLASSVKIDNKSAGAIYSTPQSLWLMVGEGRHTVNLGGKIPPGNSLQLSLPLKPHRLEVEKTGWTMEGAHRDGAIDNQLHFKRIAEEGRMNDSFIPETGVLPSFARIERTLRLGLDWRIETTVTRLSPPGSAIIIEYPLLASEAVVSGNVKFENGAARINLDPQSTFLKFDSIIAKDEELHLKHAQTNEWTEIWQVDASPIFHLDYQGIPVILHQIGNRWMPTWHPWPGEELQLTISHPQGVAGQTVTIDKSRLEVRPGRRATDTELELDLRSSRGGQHTITMPPDSQLQEITVNGLVQTIRQEGSRVTVPISPGEQKIDLSWRQTNGITTSYRTPQINLGLPAANIAIDLKLPDNRWPLLVFGPAVGPAILFWSVLVVIVLVAYGLRKSGLTPLNFYQWLLLGIGLSQSNLIGGLLVVGWLIALELRRKTKVDIDRGTFNLIQACLIILTALALLTLMVAISRGLLGHPDMNIVGNGSGRNLLRWYQDYSGNIMPRAWLLSVPLFWYRLAMLAWALWISFTLIRILRRGWQAFSEPIIWYPTELGKRFSKKKTPPVANELDLTTELQTEEKKPHNE